MRRGFVFGVTVMLLLAATWTAGAAQEYKIGYIDSERIFAEYTGTKEAQDQFDRDVEAWRQEAEQSEADLEEMRKELESQRLLLSQSALDDKERELRTKVSEYESFVQSVWGPTGRIAQRNAELTKPIVEKIRTVLDKIGQEQGFSIIFDAADGNIVYGEKTLDLTDQVLVELNKELEP
jgi:outer membrane protein